LFPFVCVLRSDAAFQGPRAIPVYEGKRPFFHTPRRKTEGKDDREKALSEKGTTLRVRHCDGQSDLHTRPESTFVDSSEATGHLVRNDGSVNLVVTVVRLVLEGAVQRLDLDNPGYCPGLNLNEKLIGIPLGGQGSLRTPAPLHIFSFFFEF